MQPHAAACHAVILKAAHAMLEEGPAPRRVVIIERWRTLGVESENVL